jgi:hypothetical protein
MPSYQPERERQMQHSIAQVYQIAITQPTVNIYGPEPIDRLPRNGRGEAVIQLTVISDNGSITEASRTRKKRVNWIRTDFAWPV